MIIWSLLLIIPKPKEVDLSFYPRFKLGSVFFILIVSLLDMQVTLIDNILLGNIMMTAIIFSFYLPLFLLMYSSNIEQKLFKTYQFILIYFLTGIIGFSLGKLTSLFLPNINIY